ncbi:MAG: hypothetical protein ACKO83_14440 [Roseiflexaceae bacterium]
MTNAVRPPTPVPTETTATATGSQIDRKYVQKVKAAHEQRERSLARMVITALATCGTLVGWMLFAKPASSNQPIIDAPGVPVATTESLPPTAIVLSVAAAPVPTVAALPTFAPLPTLVVVDNVVAAPAVVVVAAPSSPGQTNPQSPVVAVDAMPALRVVAMPTAIPVAAPRPGQPNPANPNPNPGGNTGGSK